MRTVIPLHAAPAVAKPPSAAHGSPPLSAAMPLSLYVHFPWCVRKCPYCDFNSHASPASIPEDDYLAALLADLEAALPAIWGRRVGSVFIGGGTPSLLSERGVDRLLAALRARLPLAGDCEITLEANPGTVEAARFKGYRAAGVTRVSLGVQSFDEHQLRALGRIHGADEARRAAAVVAETFATFNLDLMFALPGQTAADLQRDLDAALAFAPPHLSVYQLTIEPNTPFAAAPPELPDDDAAADLHDRVEACLAAARLENYETSAFARPGHRCRHNLNYWQFGDYLGIGPGAHSKLTLADRVVRQMRWKSPRQYLENAATNAMQSESGLATGDLAFEYLMNALRLADGFHIDDFERRSGQPWLAVAAEVARAEADGLLQVDGAQVRPSARGRRLLNQLLQRFLP